MERSVVVLLFGGESREYEISLRSAAFVYERLKDACPLFPVGITRDGRWLAYDGPMDRLPDDVWHTDPSRLSQVRLLPGELLAGERRIRPRAVLPILHGGAGEDGRLQGLLDLFGLPYLGSGAASSSSAMHKHVAKALCAAAGLPVLPWIIVSRGEIDRPADLLARIRGRMDYPLFVKPDAGGSSVGCAPAEDDASLLSALGAALACDTLALVEPRVFARECEVAVFWQGGRYVASRPGGIACDAAYYDYDAKYNAPATRLSVPADLPTDAADRMRRLALAVFDTLGCRDLGRCDFFFSDRDGAILFNELNTLPGMTERSLFPALLEDAGYPFAAFLRDVIRPRRAAGARPS